MINIVCLKWGTRYSAEWVNRLYTMVKKNYDGEFKFWCCTDDPIGLISEINPINLPYQYDLEKWWWKLWFFSKDFPVKGNCLYFDLDIVIQNDITELVKYNLPGVHFVKGTIYKFNSSIILWESTANHHHLWDKFASKIQYYLTNYENGDDEYFSIEFSNYIKILPTKWFYGRINSLGVGKTYYLDRIYDPIWDKKWDFYRIPEKMICICNGLHRPEYSEYMRKKIMEDFKSYWE
jgi:hypothetical protein